MSPARGHLRSWIFQGNDAGNLGEDAPVYDPTPSVLTDGNTVAWFDSSENITKDGSDFVSVWGDKSVDAVGDPNGNNLLQY